MTTTSIHTSQAVPQKETALVICPGRGTYNKDELGYLQRYHGDKPEVVALIDRYRALQGQPSIAELDGLPRYSMREHSLGENASALIHACAYSDYLAIDRTRYDIVAVTGNSMGWYIALTAAGALNQQAGIELINTMGSMMQGGLIGGQSIYPVIDDQWRIDPARVALLDSVTQQINHEAGCELHLSITLGGYRVLGGNEPALKRLEELLPQQQERFPMRLYNHAAFHTPLLQSVSERAFSQLGEHLFQPPGLPLIDGQGRLWQPYSTDVAALRQYTLGHQVYAPYDFSKAVEVSLKEFAPERVIILGPGATLGGSVAQVMIDCGWRGLRSKNDFLDAQADKPILLSMGMEAQRALVV